MFNISQFSLQGLRVGDEVMEFGSVNAGNFQNLQSIAAVVSHSEGVSTKCQAGLLKIQHSL